jgi:predicted NBD/HSP70 family sugar kinase
MPAGTSSGDAEVSHGGSQSALRAANRQRVIEALRHNGTMIQADLARATGLSAASVSTLVRDLAAEGLLRTSKTVSGGRRARAVSLERLAGVAAGIDFGRRHVRVTLADLSHQVLGEEEVAIEPRLRASAEINIAVDLFHETLKSSDVSMNELIGVGVGVPGPIDSRDGNVGSASILPEWVGVNPAEIMGQRLGTDVVIDNDANLGALAELTWGAARGHQDVIYIKIATGIGAGIVLGGRVHRGHVGVAGELGHLTMDENGAVCRCGNRGCLETVASVGVALDLLRPRFTENLTIGSVVQMATDGDAACARVIGDIGRHVGLAISNVCNLLNPSVVVVGGTLVPAGEILMEPLRAAVQRFAIPTVGASTEVVASTLGRRAESLGAVASALRASKHYVLDSALSSNLDDKLHSASTDKAEGPAHRS